MSHPNMVVEVTVTASARQKVDLIEFFAKFDERDQQRYRNLDIATLGMDAEWERPLAYLWPEDDDVVPMTLVTGAQHPVWGDIDEADVRLTRRFATPVHGTESRWTEADFKTLLDHVGWMRTFHAIKNNPDATPEDLARIPGPDDVPMF